jgi:hypothetical protein
MELSRMGILACIVMICMTMNHFGRSVVVEKSEGGFGLFFSFLFPSLIWDVVIVCEAHRWLQR